MKTNPFHSDEPGIWVYHNSSRCTTGKNIKRINFVKNTGKKRLCSRCKRLEK